MPNTVVLAIQINYILAKLTMPTQLSLLNILAENFS
jgi:hypothetical protein